jgi:hypothetical protein
MPSASSPEPPVDLLEAPAEVSLADASLSVAKLTEPSPDDALDSIEPSPDDAPDSIEPSPDNAPDLGATDAPCGGLATLAVESADGPPPTADLPRLTTSESVTSLAPTEEIVIPKTRVPWAALGAAIFIALGLGVTLVWASGESSVEASDSSATSAQTDLPQQPRAQEAAAAPKQAPPPPPANTAPAPAETEAPPPEQPTPPGKPAEARPDVNGPAIEYRVSAALVKAQDCHRGGRATGTARVIMTFDPKGTVSETRLEGEPLASAPVGNCIRTVMNGVVVPKFDGGPVTIEREITLR